MCCGSEVTGGRAWQREFAEGIGWSGTLDVMNAKDPDGKVSFTNFYDWKCVGVRYGEVSSAVNSLV